MSTLLRNSPVVDSMHGLRLIGGTVRSMRQSLGVSLADLARASGMPGPRIAAIEQGSATTRSEQDDIAVAFGWLSNHRIARGLNGRTGPRS